MRKRRLLIICLIFALFFFNTSIINASVPDTVLKQKDAVVTIIVYENDKPLVYGSGFIIDSNGIVATNYHVVSLLFEKQEASIAIKMANGEFIKAQKLLSINEEKDIALIQVESKGLPSVRLAKDYKSKQGDEVFVIGSPYGLETTVSNGIISSIRGEDEFLQITAPISGGSSGSPVFNANGEVTGIATLIIQGGQNINFAIPLKYITEIQQSTQNSKTETLKATVPPPAVKSVAENKVKSIDEHIKLAKEHYINRRWNEAFEAYKNAISERPSDPFLYFAQAKTALKAVRYYAPAVGQTEAAIENEKTEKENANIYNLAIENYSKAIALQPDNVVFYYARALTYDSKEEYENAVKDLDKAISLEPNISFLYESRCRVNDELKLYEDAITDCTKAINLKPNMQHYFLLFLSPFKEVGFSEEELKKQIGYPIEKTNLGSFYLRRASIYQKNGNIDEQIKDNEKYVMIYPEFSSGLYILYEKEGRLDENALKFYNHAITVYPKEGSLYRNRGDFYRELKQDDKALKDYTRAIELCPKCATYYWSRAILYNDLKQYDKAIKDYTIFIAHYPLGTGMYKARGEVYLKINEKQKALRDFMKSCELSDEEACAQVKTIQKDINRGDKWVKYFEGGGGRNFYYDKTSIKQQLKKYMMVWTRFEVDDVAAYVQERKNNDLPIKGYENFSHNLTSHRIECSSEQIGLISTVVYDTNDRVINSYTNESKIMEPIVPDSMGASLLKTVCDRKKK